MEEIDALEMKEILGSLLDRVERGEEIVITATTTNIDSARAQGAAERIRARAESMALPCPDWETLKAERDQGRP
jgi:antitoxin (DNA-binding transcriptional repressor) of toxin-antitoxin stability system